MDKTPALPSVFLSHGSPMIALEPGAAGAFMQQLGPAIDTAFGRPRAIIAISAHTLTRTPVLLAAARHDTIHDFGGFPEALYRLRYDAPGAPDLAADLAQRLHAAGIEVQVTPEGGLDHGIWTVLRHVYPQADVPILPLAFVPTQGPAQQFALGEALQGLGAEGVLVLGSGSITHNLRRLFGPQGRVATDTAEIAESAGFRHWMAERSAARDWEALFDYRARAPHAVDMHPTDEHLLPWYVAAGAGGRTHAPMRLHDSVTHGLLGMDAYAFGESAGLLAETIATR